MSDFREAFNKIRYSVVGIGIRNDPEYEIFGTGTIIHPSGWILTNKHVLDPLIDPKLNKIRADAAAFLFIENPPEGEFDIVAGIGVASIVELTFPPSNDNNQSKENTKPPKYRNLDPVQSLGIEEPDIGVCRINIPRMPEYMLPLKPAKFIHSRSVVEGTSIAVLGFPRGLYLPGKYESISQIQITPLLQKGIISGILPFSMSDHPTSFVLDMMINPGSSGSPVFLENGEIVGVVYATRLAYEPIQEIVPNNDLEGKDNLGVYVPTGLGLAVPSARLPNEWLSTD